MNLSIISKTIILLKLANAEITTVNIIRTLNGKYVIDTKLPSVNARFGKMLQQNSSLLGIKKVGSKAVRIGHSTTTTAVWA